MPPPIGFAIVLDGAGGIRATLDVDRAAAPPVPEPAVILLNSTDPRTAAWVEENSGLEAVEREALLAPVRRTWGEAFELRGERAAVLALEAIAPTADHSAGAGAVRVLASRSRLVVLLDLTLPTPMLDRARDRLRAGRGPRSPAEMFIDVARFWNERYLEDALELDKATTALEERTLESGAGNEIETLHRLRRAATSLRRRGGSHRTAIACVCGLEGTDLVDSQREQWRALLRQSDEVVDLISNVGERLRAIDDHVQNRLSTTLGDRLYVLTLISAIFLPLSFVTGLLGVNVGGIPLRETSWAFWLLCVFLVGLAVAQYGIAKRLNWLPRQDPLLRRQHREQQQQRVKLGGQQPQQA